MLTAVKNQFKVLLLSVKYNLMREMTNRVSFLTNVVFMMLNNASFIIIWLFLFSLKENIGGYRLNDIMILWGIASGTHGVSHIFFQSAYFLPDFIINGKLDAFLVQPKNVLLTVISSSTNSSAVGDIIYGYLMIVIFNFSISNLLLFTYFCITGGIIMTAFAVITGSLSFWLIKGDMISNTLNVILVIFSTYPDNIFKGIIRLLLYTIVPVGLYIYIPLKTMLNFSLSNFLIVTAFTVGIVLLAFFIFYRGLKRYSSSNLMSARI